MSGFVFSQNAPLKFEHKVQKFGKVEEGQDINLVYTFVNMSENPVLINETKVNCTCTKVEFPKAPINPGGSGTIDVSFNTLGKIGYQERKVEIITNGGIAEIIFKGVVKASKESKDKYKEQQSH